MLFALEDEDCGVSDVTMEDAIRHSMYEERAALYDAIYHWKRYEEESAALHALLASEGVDDGARVLEAACGTGSYLVHLAARYAVSGFDLSTARSSV